MTAAMSSLLLSMILLMVSALAVLFYLVRYFLAMAPRAGTLEWIAMTRKPSWSRCTLYRPEKRSLLVFLSAAASAGLLGLYQSHSLVDALWTAAGGLLFSLLVYLFGGSKTQAYCATLLLGISYIPNLENLALLLSLGLLIAGISERNLLRRMLLLIFGLVVFLASRFTCQDGEWVVKLPVWGYVYSLRMPLCLLLLCLPVCLVQTFRLRSGRCLLGAILLLMAPLNWLFGFVYPVYCCLLLGFTALAGDACRRGARTETAVVTGILLLSAFLFL